MIKSYKDILAYQNSKKLFPIVYKIVRTWSYLDQKELGSQIIRAANSIHANIAEGYGKSVNDFKRYLNNALGSCDELLSHLEDASNVNLIISDVYERLRDDYTIIGKQIYNLRKNWK